ncbi:MAG: OmpA family protein [Albidovulum sp.]|uniref:OmpA family protein n=1 Tax=Albidovulum sp. TaxID=1872424 RepID=UPI003CBC46A9
MKRFALALLCLAPAAQAAPTLSMPPTAARTAEEATVMGSYALPVGPWSDGAIKTLKAEGEITQTAWRIREGDITTMAVLSALRDQLRGEGFDILFECNTDECGGFDFRFATKVLPEPDMHVDLGDFRFLSARRIDGPVPDYVSLLISRSSDSSYVQMTRVGAALSGPLPIAAARFTARDVQPSPGALSDELTTVGKVVLDDLDFASGAPRLSDGQFSSLAALAEYLKANPDRSVALVGHTDSEGSLAGNVALSRKRAQSVLDRLVYIHGVDPAQLSADGVGFLSPVASNLTPEGRTQNRRVEALITSTR